MEESPQSIRDKSLTDSLTINLYEAKSAGSVSFLSAVKLGVDGLAEVC